MIGSLRKLAAALLFLACTSVPVPRVAPALVVNHDSGGSWPRVTTAKVYSDGTLELDDARGSVRARVRPDDPRFGRLIESLGRPGFAAAIAAASVPTPMWKSSGEWIRIQHGGITGRVKPPEVSAELCAAIADVDVLFEQAFGRRYRAILPMTAAGACSS